MPRTVQHDTSLHRFEITEDNVVCVLDYHLNDDIFTVTHTGVPHSVGGRGIAADLTVAALEYAKTNKLKVRPQCSYAASFINSHPEYQNLLA